MIKVQKKPVFFLQINKLEVRKMVDRNEQIFSGQSLNIALQIVLARVGPEDKDEDKLIKELFRLGLKVFKAGKKAGFLEWAGRD